VDRITVVFGFPEPAWSWSSWRPLAVGGAAAVLLASTAALLVVRRRRKSKSRTA
jgi:LPXTG-motif cell wall-anchored protein